MEAFKNQKHEAPDEVSNEFLKFSGEVLTQTLQSLFKMIFDSGDIPHQWKISMLININKGQKDKEKLEYKRGIPLCNNTNKLFEKIIVNNHLHFTEAHAGARPQKRILKNLENTENQSSNRENMKKNKLT